MIKHEYREKENPVKVAQIILFKLVADETKGEQAAFIMAICYQHHVDSGTLQALQEVVLGDKLYFNSAPKQIGTHNSRYVSV